MPGGDGGDDSGRGGYTPAAEMVECSSPNSNADGIDSTEVRTTGGLAFPLGSNGASKITKVEVENLAMVDSVSVEVGVRLCRNGVDDIYLPRRLPLPLSSRAASEMGIWRLRNAQQPVCREDQNSTCV